MGRRGAAATLALHLTVVATLALAAATFMSTAEAGCSNSMAHKVSNRSGRFRVPEGGQDGLYMGTVEVDEQGEEQYRVKFLGAGNTTLDTDNNNNISRAATGGGLGRKLLQDTGTHCDGGLVDAWDMNDAVTEVANYFGPGGNTIPGRKVLFGVAGCAVAYVCNYNNGPLRTTSAIIWSDTYALNEACTVNGGGWYGHETSNSRNGRTYFGNDLC